MIALLLAAVAAETPKEQPAHIFYDLSGYCYRAERNGGSTDTHCFSTATGGDLVMDVHKVRDAAGAAVYEGVTLYRSGENGAEYGYYNSFGDLMTGRAHRDRGDIVFTDIESGALQVRWRLSVDGYTVHQGGQTVVFVRLPEVAANGL